MKKQCKCCKLNKSLLEFGIRKISPDSLHYYCKECASKFTKKSYKKSQRKQRELTIIIDGMKKCTKCQCTKSISEFSLNKQTISGLNAMCKSCISELRKSYKEYKKMFLVKKGWLY